MAIGGLVVADNEVLLADKVGGYDSVMEIFVFVAFNWTGQAGTWFTEVRTPDLPELQCKLMKMQIDHAGGRAWCEIQGRREPVWTRPPRIDPAPVCAACRTIKERGRAPA
jgi:hypothetical protein